MKLAQHERLLVNVEGCLHKPLLIKLDNEWVENNYAWVYRATVTLAIGVKPVTLRVLQATGDHRTTTCPRFVGRFRLESEPFHLDEKANGYAHLYHQQADIIARYAADNGLYAHVTELPPLFYFNDPRFVDILKQEESRQ